MSSYCCAAPADVFLVGRGNDPVLVATAAAVRAKGATAQIVGHVDHSARLSVHMTGDDATVQPDRPMFMRRWTADSTGALSPFKLNELYAHLWSAAALTRAPVLNRPQPFGHVTSFPRVLVLRLWNRAPHLRHLITPERYADAVEDSPDLESESLGMNVAESGASAPLRIRDRMPIHGRFMRTAVVGRTAVVLGDPAQAPAGLTELTVEVGEALELTFAQIVWRFDRESDGARIARISGDPGVAQLGAAMPRVCAAAAAYLLP